MTGNNSSIIHAMPIKVSWTDINRSILRKRLEFSYGHGNKSMK